MIRLLSVLLVSSLVRAEAPHDSPVAPPPPAVAAPPPSSAVTGSRPGGTTGGRPGKGARNDEAPAAKPQAKKPAEPGPAAAIAAQAKKEEAAAKAAQAAAENAAPAPAAPAAPPQQVNWKLVELFNVEQLPGSGTVTFKFGDKTETAPLGPELGYYALGLVFRGDGLPEQYGRDFKKSDILQLAFGSMRSRLQGQIPQFGAATLIARGIPEKQTRFPFVVPTGGKDNALDQMGFLLVTSPSTPNERTDEEKLKGTYFAQTGAISLTPKGGTKVIEAKSGGKRVTFRLQMMRAELDASLTTPFNAQPSSMKGTFEFPLYYPQNKEAMTLTQRIASESLETQVNIPGQEGLSNHSRGVAGSTKENTNRQ